MLGGFHSDSNFGIPEKEKEHKHQKERDQKRGNIQVTDYRRPEMDNVEIRYRKGEILLICTPLPARKAIEDHLKSQGDKDKA